MSKIKDDLKSGKSIIGTMIVMVDNPDIIKVCQVVGFDLVIIDCEHGGIDYGPISRMLGMGKVIGLPTLVRIPEARREVILKYMEMGAAGFLLPNCESAEEAKALCDHALYYPDGNRGVSMLRAHTGFTKPASATEYMKQANADTLLICQIESPTGVDNIDSILDVPGVDAAFIGPNDLSQSYGLMGQFDHPTVVGAIDKVIASAKKHNKYSGIHIVGPTANLKKWMDKGMTLNLWSNELTMMMNNAQQGLKELR